MRKFLEKCLARSARRLLGRVKPEIVAVTGSVGKSSTKQAVAAVLAKRVRVAVSPKNYNTEIGLPLAVLGLLSPGRSLWRWLVVGWRGWWLSLRPPKDYAQTLVLEMGADKPGDIAYLCGIAAPRIGVVTAIGESHVEKFGSVEAIVKEKRILVERLPKDGVAVLNRDDERVWAMAERTKAEVVGFGFDESADVRAVEVSMQLMTADDPAACGTRFKVAAGGSVVPMFMPGMLGAPAVYAALAAVAVGLAHGMNLVEVAEGLRQFQPAPGRMRCLVGIKRTSLIDDSYNAAPRSTLAALATLASVAPEQAHRFAVLGDMLELGAMSQEGHEAVGRRAVECADTVVFVGERMGDAQRAAMAAGAGDDRVFHFATAAEAGRFVQERMKQGDCVLVKGSRGMKMEVVTKELMAEPLRAADWLPGEHEEWRMN